MLELLMTDSTASIDSGGVIGPLKVGEYLLNFSMTFSKPGCCSGVTVEETRSAGWV